MPIDGESHGDRSDAPARDRHRQWWLLALAALLVLAGGAVGLQWWIVANAHAIGARAVREFGGDEVGALLVVVKNQSLTLARRNEAVYALGQIGDPRALATLERLETGRPCDHARELCQCELKKAIERCRGEGTPPWAPRPSANDADRPSGP